MALFGMRFNPADGSFGTAGKYFRGSQRGNDNGPGSSAGNSSGNSNSSGNGGNGGQNSRGSRGQGYGGRDPGGRNGGNRDGRGARQTNRSDSRFGGNRNRNGSGQRQAQRSAAISNAASQRAAAERAAAQAQEQKQSRFAISQQNRAKQIGIQVSPGRQIAPGLDTQPSSPGYKQSAQDSFEGLAVGERSRRNTQAAEYASATPDQKKSFRNNALAGIGSLAGFAIGGPVGLALGLGSAALGAFGTGEHSRGGLATAAGLASPVPGVGTAIRASGISKDISDNAAILGRSKSVGRHNTNLDADRAEARALGARASVGRQSNQDAVNAATSYGSIGRQSDQSALRAATSFASTGRQSNRAVNDTALSNASTGRQSNRAVNDAALSNASVGRQSNRAVQDTGLSYGSRGRHNASTDVGLQSISNAFTGATPDSVGPTASPTNYAQEARDRRSQEIAATSNVNAPASKSKTTGGAVFGKSYQGRFGLTEDNISGTLAASAKAERDYATNTSTAQKALDIGLGATTVVGAGAIGLAARGLRSLGSRLGARATLAGDTAAAVAPGVDKGVSKAIVGSINARRAVKGVAPGTRAQIHGAAVGRQTSLGRKAAAANVGSVAAGGTGATAIGVGTIGRFGGKKASGVVTGLGVSGAGTAVSTEAEAQGNLGAGIGNISQTPSLSAPTTNTSKSKSTTSPGGVVGASPATPGSPAPATPGSPQLSSPSTPPSVVAPGTPTSPAPSVPSAPSTNTTVTNAEGKPGPNGGVLGIDGSGNIIEILPDGRRVPIQGHRTLRRGGGNTNKDPVQNYTNQYYRRHAGGVLGIQPQRRPKA